MSLLASLVVQVATGPLPERNHWEAWYDVLRARALDLSRWLPRGASDFDGRKLLEFVLELRRALDEDDGETAVTAALAIANAARLIASRSVSREAAG